MGTRGPRSKLEPYDEDIRRMYVDEGLTDKAIAEALPIDVKEETVRQRRNKLGIKTNYNKSTGRFSREADYEKVKDELPAAWERSKRWHKRQKRMVGSAARVGEEFGVSQVTANKWLKRHGLVESRSGHSSEAKDNVLRLFNEGASVPKVAEQTGVPQSTAAAWITESGVDLSAEHYTKRMSHEEYIAWKQSIREAKGYRNLQEGRYSYADQPFDSPQEVILAQTCDRLGVEWEKFDRSGAVEWKDADGELHLYGPDLVVAGIPVEVKGFYGERDHTKVLGWRATRGELSLVDMVTIPQVEAAGSAEYLIALIKANCYYTPEVREGELHF